MPNFEIPKSILSVLATLENAGHQAILVGGCARDMSMGRNVNDWDAATSATPGEVAGLFPKTAATGEKYGTITVFYDGNAVEVTTFRSEGSYKDGRRPDEVGFIANAKEDLARRDFTMNAMGITRTGELIDPFGGIADIKRKLIRCVGIPEERFSEDALRMLRALRFSATLGFDIEPDTMMAIEKCAPLSHNLSAERIRDEIEKMLMSDVPEVINAVIGFGFLARFLTGRIGRQSIKTANISLLPKNSAHRFCALCAILLDAGLILSVGEFLRGLRLDGKTVKLCRDGISAAGDAFPSDVTDIKRLLAEYGIDAAYCAVAADKVLRGGNNSQRLKAVIDSGECFSLKDLKISGDDLAYMGISPGIETGEKLRALLVHVIDNPEDNEREILLKLAAEMQ